ncbi:MAG: TRL-like family protein [Leptospirales bacterium]|nr:TRL-like family protein [Leptospirales bacterium]
MQQNWIKRGLVVLCLSIGLLTVNCVGFGPQGLLFSSTKIGVYGTEPGGTKTGRACAMSILNLIAIGDGSVQTSADEGGIKNVKNIDLEGFSVLGLFSQLCTVTHGD